MDPDVVASLKALTDATRLRIVGRLAAGPASLDALAAELDLPLAVVVRHVGLLRRAGLVGRPGRLAAGTWELRRDTLQALGRALDARPRASFGASVPEEEARVLRAYVEGGRLTVIPANGRKRSVVLGWLCEQVFTEDREYPEREVNQRLALFHRDVASLRRHMVDAGMVSREGGLYRRVPRPLERSGV